MYQFTLFNVFKNFFNLSLAYANLIFVSHQNLDQTEILVNFKSFSLSNNLKACVVIPPCPPGYLLNFVAFRTIKGITKMQQIQNVQSSYRETFHSFWLLNFNTTTWHYWYPKYFSTPFFRYMYTCKYKLPFFFMIYVDLYINIYVKTHMFIYFERE